MNGLLQNTVTTSDRTQTYWMEVAVMGTIGLDELFMWSAFYAYVKIAEGQPSYTLLIGRFLRLAPLYYAVFLYGWFIGSQLHRDSSPWWYTYEMGF